MTLYIAAYIGTLVAFFMLDMAWLGVVARKFYARQMGDMMAIRWGWAITFYLIYIVGIVIFAVHPALQADGDLKTAAIMGGLFGFFCYATYDLTNLATLKGWPEKMSFVDIPWGVVLTGSCAVFGTFVARFFL